MKASQSRFGLVWLTLIAFSVQLAVAVLHHHHDVARGTGMAARAITAGLCGPASKRPCNPAPHQQDHDGCVLCWASAIAANSLEPPPLPQLPLPQIVAGVRLDVLETSEHRPLHRDHFQARGPPTSDAA
ncbi:hypothetical protein [Hyphomicrobium sp.]|jgi:hypothetical protein|uniref:hypothetical protein n=1 Tax=Hyphomicrobium sp. TaxID=82 RepID=UPI002B9A278F|nr:hypothetical protein [Hyphomicrobium sp.]HVZ03359.1 hypothetical protein [Hyphomicrobium sp.]